MNKLSIACSLAFSLAAMTAAAASPPDIVVFISDDHGYFDSQVAGNNDVTTPHMLRLAQDGMTFTGAFAASPSCAPSRAAFLTGLMPARNGAMFNHQPPRADVKKLPAYLHEAGYEVVAFGKVAHYEQAVLYGFDHASHDTFHDQQCIPAALQFLKQRRSSKPLCLLVGTNWPHVPWPQLAPTAQEREFALPPSQIDTPETRRWRARYYAAVERMDADLGQVYDAAYAALGKDTLFVHFSDHGAQWPFGKWNLYDSGVRVPFFVVWPGVVRPGAKSDAMLSLVDLLPTLVEAAGAEAPADVDGLSFLAVLRGEAAAHREEVFMTHSGDGRMNEYPIRAIRTAQWKLIRNLRPEAGHHTHIDRGKPVDGSHYWQSWIDQARSDPGAQAIVDRYFRRPGIETYHVADDLHELHNLTGESGVASSQTPPTAELSRWLDDWMKVQLDAGLETERAVKDAFEQGK